MKELLEITLLLLRLLRKYNQHRGNWGLIIVAPDDRAMNELNDQLKSDPDILAAATLVERRGRNFLFPDGLNFHGIRVSILRRDR